MEMFKSRCTMEFYFERKEIVVQPRHIAYSGWGKMHLIQFLQNKSYIITGPVELQLYTVVGVNYCTADIRNFTGLVVEFLLQKPLTGNFLTQFLPTSLFLLIRRDIY